MTTTPPVWCATRLRYAPKGGKGYTKVGFSGSPLFPPATAAEKVERQIDGDSDKGKQGQAKQRCRQGDAKQRGHAVQRHDGQQGEEGGFDMGVVGVHPVMIDCYP